MKDNHYGNSRWFLKSPFTTHGVYRLSYRTAKTFLGYEETAKSLIGFIKSPTITNTYKDTVDYLMLQPCMANPREVKVVVIGGKAQYICNRSSTGHAFHFNNDEAILKFAEDSVAVLKQYCDHALVSILVRVDVMENFQGKLIVNEFEAYEADFDGAHHTDTVKANATLMNIWKTIINSNLDKFMHDY